MSFQVILRKIVSLTKNGPEWGKTDLFWCTVGRNKRIKTLMNDFFFCHQKKKSEMWVRLVLKV